ncbi:MAG: arginyl-tRNA synthetase [Patescibacteria group bacterium]|nr:arginyl-tRNA synthetase [Patescibacteria group bacterium]
MPDKIKEQIQIALGNLNIQIESIVLEHPADLKNGDYSTNVAMACAKQAKINPRILAEKIVEELNKNKIADIEKIEVAGAGFINFYLSREFFTNSVKEILNNKESWGQNKILTGKKIMVEYTDPNPFKPFHIGHLMTNAIGESIARIVEFSGAQTVRANYQGDVGMHVAKAIYGMYKAGPPANESAPASEIALYIGECYAKGSDAYDSDPEAKKEIEAFNKKVYDRSDEQVNQVYDWGRKATLEAFEEIYKILGTKFVHYFFESVMAPIGEKIVRANIPNVFTESEGAIVFKAEEHDPKLHTRVFITTLGIPLYETKEIGLTMTKFEKEPDMDLSIVVTAIEQGEYMKVVQKAISLMHPELEKKMKHITHGMMRLTTGKMSSRKGNIITGESLLHDSIDTVYEKMKDREMGDVEKKEVAEIVGVSALKYSILRSSLGSDIIYDFEKSISFEGDSGPYLQYTAVRANAILKKAKEQDIEINSENAPEEITVLEKLLYQFPEVVAHSYEELEPHHIATYLTELASAFNSFYGNTLVVNKDDQHSGYRAALVEAFKNTMKNGLYLLGIQTPEKM